MHTLLSPRAHGVIDYVAVALFALAPTVLGLSGLAATLSYALAAIHLLMTVGTAFPLGVVAVVPFRLHGMVELGVGAGLVLGGFLAFEGTAQAFFITMGVVILAVWAATAYDAPAAA